MDYELKQIGTPEQFTPTQWNNSSGPAISAEQLNRLENALVVLLGIKDSNTGVVQQLVSSNNHIADTYVEKTELPDFSTYATNEQLNKVSTEITDINGKLSNKVDSQHTHFIADITNAPDFSTYVTKTELPDLREFNDADGIYAKSSDISKISENISSLTDDLTNVVEEITDITDNYATQKYVDEKVTELTGFEFDNYYKKDETVGLDDTITLNCGNAATLID